MKEMVYSTTRNIEVLDRETYKDYDYVVLSLGTHPCGYVRIPENHPYYGEDYDNCYIDCHGGITYGSPYLRTSYDTQEIGWWIGWDYAHCDDYCGYMTYDCGIRHTTKEIQHECFTVIEQLIEIKSKN